MEDHDFLVHVVLVKSIIIHNFINSVNQNHFFSLKARSNSLNAKPNSVIITPYPIDFKIGINGKLGKK